MNYSKTIEWLFQQFPAYHNQGVQAYNPGLKNIEELSTFFGNPEKKLRFIHVGGTNGKGSVSNILASILTESHEKVGLFTSPHLFDFTERIRINGIPVEQQFVIEFCEKIRNHTWNIQPSFFEITWMMALEYFSRNKCTIVIAEVGLGGRLDATNIITPLVSVITNIGLDHVQILGSTRLEIAAEKAGIIKESVPVVLGEIDDETFPIFKSAADKQTSRILIPDPETIIPKEIIGYQIGNYRIVSTVCDFLVTIGFTCGPETRVKGIHNLKANTGFFGRMEIISEHPLIIADCAHNAEGIQALMSAVSSLNKGRLHCIYSTSSDKDLDAILKVLPSEAHFYFTTFSNPRSIALQDLKEKTGNSIKNAIFFHSPLKAFKAAQESANKEDTILIFGSFFLIHDFFEVFFPKPLAETK
ncbi:folylpolyglutamate synthase/dihydrofolate synthase family protein [Fluviicola sp.]|jgi:dihydrofolate synthase/folylpolyglutamate synthase|uniref:bifunctional folylpolyglutamate synthase/dihydrofolate synthase n=1 Tax=Fluviicola sp. TaxID=1917219 RepID=UPI0028223EDB|nr:folylpolyglutamate synthase/dihydrofolate synthase family protein [Fluviicola sp.]MDR0802418.1 bifunctional folylpolyglutamate synthase/dihydrofolate synthase [Fluviicola sp.]